MKSQSILRNLAVAIAAVLLVVSTGARAADYTIDWSTIDGGGGTSTGGVYSVSGTIGQPDAGKMTGGSFSLEGGFWGVAAAVQTPGAPLLTVTRTNANVRISWSAPAPNWLLEQTNVLTGVAGTWTPVPPPYTTNATEIFTIVPATPGNQFFRLHK